MTFLSWKRDYARRNSCWYMTHTYTHTHLCVCMYIYIYTHIYICIFKNKTHTYMQITYSVGQSSLWLRSWPRRSTIACTHTNIHVCIQRIWILFLCHEEGRSHTHIQRYMQITYSGGQSSLWLRSWRRGGALASQEKDDDYGQWRSCDGQSFELHI